MIGHKTHCVITFDRSVIKRNWSKMNRNPIQAAGVRVMRYARNRIRRGRVTKRGLRRPSKPGQSPKSWYPGAVPPMKMIYSVPDRLGTRAIIGFVGFGSPMPVPAVHEHGKIVVRRVFRPQYRQGRRKPVMKPVRKPVRYPKRPTMLPTLIRVAPTLPSLWRGSLHE